MQYEYYYLHFIDETLEVQRLVVFCSRTNNNLVKLSQINANIEGLSKPMTVHVTFPKNIYRKQLVHILTCFLK